MMDCSNRSVSLVKCESYQLEDLKSYVNTVLSAENYTVKTGDTVLLKPNLVSASGHKGNAVTHPKFVAAIAAWCIDQGALVSIGDSPAFGSAKTVMESFGYTEALRGLSVTLLNFRKKKKIKTRGGFSLVVAGEMDEHDHLINLPKIKAHSQLRVTMAVKNYFGLVLSWRKAFAHMQHGDSHFMELLVDLLDSVPGGISIADGVSAMHQTGPVGGDAFALSVIGASRNPIALDSAFLKILNVDPVDSPLWGEVNKRGLGGCDVGGLEFPLEKPEELSVHGFVVPMQLSPVRFQVHSFAINSIKKLFS